MVRRVMGGAAVFACLMLVAPVVVLAAPPGNDDIGSATTISALPFTDSLDTSEATMASDDPDCVGNGPTVWYVYTPTSNQTLLADTFGSDYDTTLSVYTGSPGDLVQIECNDDAGSGLQSAVLFDAEASTTYYFMIGAFASGPGGNLEFHVDESDLEPTEVEVTINATGRFDSKTGSVLVAGTITCSEGAFGYVEVSLEQRVGRRSVFGYGSAFVECDGSSQTWSAEVWGENGLFKGGHALASVFAEACGTFDCAFDFEQRSVSLKR